MGVDQGSIYTQAKVEPSDTLVADFLRSVHNPTSRRAYRSDIHDFFCGEPTAEQILEWSKLHPPDFQERLQRYIRHQRTSRRLTKRSILRRLTTLGRLAKYAGKEELRNVVARAIDGLDEVFAIIGPKVENGGENTNTVLTVSELKSLMATPDTSTVRGLRDAAILELLCCYALDRSQLCNLVTGDFLSTSKTLLLSRSGTREQKTRESKKDIVAELSLTQDTAEAIASYLAKAGHSEEPESPLFRSFDPREENKGQGLTVDGIYHLIRLYGDQLDLTDLTSRQLKRAAIAAVLQRVQGDVKAAHRQLPHLSWGTLSRHAEVQR